jgi:hypothetical protein|tara:strand:+ start:349 stop:591 length:243 start_codon:yes stop_codon:yes gene_type:complete
MTIDKSLVRKGDREQTLLNKLLSYAKDYRSSYDEGGKVKPPEIPIDIDEYLALGVQIANMSKAQRESLDFMLEKLKLPKK